MPVLRAGSRTILDQVNLDPMLGAEDYMSKTVLDLFKQYLVVWKKSLNEMCQENMVLLRDQVSQNPADFSDQATIEENFSLQLKAQDRERKLIQKIDESIILIERGDYGFCDDCGVEIGYERMIARPTATMCIDCKTASELKERHTGVIFSDEDQ